MSLISPDVDRRFRNRTDVLGVDRLADRPRWDGELPAAPVSCLIRLRPRLFVLAGVLGSALLIFVVAVESHAQIRIGRLFSSPEQRVELDRLRNESDDGKDAEPVAERIGGEFRPESESGPSVFPATFDGIVIRSDGHRVAWIDGMETAVGETTPTGIRVDADHGPGGRIRIRLSHGRTSAVLEPGQFVDDGGRMHEAYESRPNGVAGGDFGEHKADSSNGAGGEDIAEAALGRDANPGTWSRMSRFTPAGANP